MWTGQWGSQAFSALIAVGEGSEAKAAACEISPAMLLAIVGKEASSHHLMCSLDRQCLAYVTKDGFSAQRKLGKGMQRIMP